MTLDDEETLHRRARFRELLDRCFEGKQSALSAHIHARTGKEANSGEMSTLKKPNGPRRFGDKKAKALCEQIGLHRQWFSMPLGTNLSRSEWMLDPYTPATENASDQIAKWPPTSARAGTPPTLAQSVEVLSLHLNQLDPKDRDAAKALLSALVSSPALHGHIATGLEQLCAGNTAKATAA